MNNVFRYLLAFAAVFICLATHAENNPTAFLGPTLRGTFADKVNSFTAYSVLGEVGIKNFRIGATVGWHLVENQRLKISGEYLWQKIPYPFFVGSLEEWVQQGAVGGLYQYNRCDQWRSTLDLGAYYSYAPSKNLSAASGVIITNNNLYQTFTDHRRIAGSTAYGFSPGATFQPWAGTIIGTEFNYDHVRYDKKHAPSQNAIGWGYTTKLNQLITENIAFNATVGFRKPFNYFAASLDWVNVPYFGLWTFGVNGAYTIGKNKLPHTWNVGLNATYSCESADVIYERSIAANFINFKCCPKSIPDDFLTWVEEPGVYMPQVLAVPDDDLVITCSAPLPRVIGSLPLVVVGVLPVIINAAALFSPSAGLTYSISVSPTPSPGNTITINPTTGIIVANHSVVTHPETVTVTITAANQCGASATTSIQVRFGLI